MDDGTDCLGFAGGKERMECRARCNRKEDDLRCEGTVVRIKLGARDKKNTHIGFPMVTVVIVSECCCLIANWDDRRF
jgi:hypothetical protein